MFPFYPPSEVMYDPLLPYPGRGVRAVPAQAYAHGRMNGYAAAMRDMKGAERVASFAQQEREAQGPPKPPEPVLRIKLEREEDKSGTKTSDGTVITEDAHKKYLAYKKKHEEYSRMLAAGLDGKKKKQPSKSSKDTRSSTSSYDTWTTDTSASDSTRRPGDRRRHHRRRDDTALGLRFLQERMQVPQSPQSMWAQPGTPQYVQQVPQIYPPPVQLVPRQAQMQVPPLQRQHQQQQHSAYTEQALAARRQQLAGPYQVEQEMPGYREQMRRGFGEVTEEMLRDRARIERAAYGEPRILRRGERGEWREH